AFIRGHIRDESQNPLNRALIGAYRPAIAWVMHRPWLTLGIAVLLLAATAYPALRIGSEFMPPLNEGTLLYMPTALPGLSAGKAGELLQQTDRLIKQFPEVKSVIERVGGQIERLIKTIPGTASAYSERVTGGRYIEAKINRLAAARYGFNIEDVQDVVTYAIGGEDVTQTIEGLQRFPVNIRYP